MAYKTTGAVARFATQTASIGQPRIMDSHTSTGTPMPVASPSPVESPKDETKAEEGALSPISSTTTTITTSTSNSTDKPLKKKYSTNDKIVRAQKEVGLFFLTGIPYSGYHYAYKAYKKKSVKRKAEKAAKKEQEKGTPLEIVDPSSELAVNNENEVSPSEADTNSSSQLRRRSTDSVSSASDGEIATQLENDAEFKEFMKAQRQAYLLQQRSRRSDSNANAEGSVTEKQREGSVAAIVTPPGVHEMAVEPPPDYDTALKQKGSTDRHRNSVAESSSSSQPPLTELRSDNTEIRELSAEPARPPLPPRPKRSPVGFISELPGDLPDVSVLVVKDPVELPAKTVET